MKKFLCVTCAIIMTSLCGVFTACGGGEGDVTGKNEFLGLKEGEEFVSDEEVLITFCRPVQNNTQEAWWTKTIEAFNTEFAGRIKVVANAYPRGERDYEQKISNLAAADELEDVVYVDGPLVPLYARSNILIPIDNYIYDGYTDDFMDYVNDQNTYNDRLYTISIVDSTVLLFYNEELLTQANITAPTSLANAWTFDNVKTHAANLTKNMGIYTRYGLQVAGDKGEWMTYAFSPLWLSGLISEDGKSTTGYINGDDGITAGKYLRSLVDSGAISASATGNDFFAKTQTAAMALTGTQQISEYLAGGGEIGDWGVTYYPKADKSAEHLAVPCGGWTVGMSNDCAPARRVAASEFIKYLTSASACEEFARETMSPPSRKSLYGSMPEYNDPSNQYYFMCKVIKEQLFDGALLRSKTIDYQTLSTEFAGAINNIISSNDYRTESEIRSRLNSAANNIDRKITNNPLNN